ncbi:enoyl-CoA hydratase-related protein [Zestomonas thermotolerans]|uniref:enoyl-CoA hydratase-related protein n=1 Tax=Zestomonas thermotolerans TaxID=157784 RepID=UPI0004862CF5|nr:enoyl-CoA hydratase-related protein [Pseudomonas thermotolerans]
MTEHVLVDRAQGLLTLRLNRPEKKNALTRAMYAALADALEQAQEDAELRAVLIRGDAQCFTAGNDLNDFLRAASSGLDDSVMRFMQALFECRKPVVAAVAGPAVGIGTTLLLHCDLVYVSRDARLRMPFVNLGLCPEYGSSLLLPRLLGPVRAAQLLMLGEEFSGEQAAAWGIANEALDDGEATLARAEAMARRFLSLPPEALALTKRLMRDPDRETLRRVIRTEGEEFVRRLRSPEAFAAMSAFMQGKKA